VKVNSIEQMIEENFARLNAAAKHRTRGMQRHEIDDAIQTAFVSMIENQGAFMPGLDGAVSGQLVAWFDGHLRNAVKAIRKGYRAPVTQESKHGNQDLSMVIGVQQHLDIYLEALEPLERACAEKLIEGVSPRELEEETGVTSSRLRELRRDLRAVGTLPMAMPTSDTFAAQRSSSDNDSRGLSRVDRQIAHGDFDAVKRAGADCPTCWRCNYFMGWAPAKLPTRYDKFDPEIAVAQRNIDIRKAEIAAAYLPYDGGI
jgi:hypothetical protein